MNKIKVIITAFLLLILLVACTPSNSDIKFYLNPGNDTVELNSEYEDPGVTAKVFGINRKTEVKENTFDISQVGVYYIIYYFHYQDIEMELTRIITVIDETPPVIELNIGVDTIRLGETWIDAGIKALDNSNDEISVNVFGIVDVNTIGTYIITYEATDIYGNSSEILRYVSVIA